MSQTGALSPELREELSTCGVPEHAYSMFTSRGLGELIPKLGIHFHELSAETARATMPVAGNTQPAGLLHGGASAALLETLGSLAANMAAGKDRIAVGTELNITHCRPAVAGQVTGTATAVKLGRTQCVHTVEIVDDAGRLISIGRMTNTLLEKPSK